MEKFPNPSISSQEFEPLPFEKKEFKEGMMMYAFKSVIVGVDTTGRNHPLFTEISFAIGSLENITGENIFNKPTTQLEGVNMAYIAQCIKTVAEDSGIHTFWFYPSGDDAAPEKKERRQAARVRLFSRFANITPEENGFGYILEV